MITFETAQAAREKLDKIFSQIGGTRFYKGSGLTWNTRDGWHIKVHAAPSAVQPGDIPLEQDGVPILLVNERSQVVTQNRGDRDS